MLNIKKILKEKFKRIQISFNQMNVPQNYVHFQVKIYLVFLQTLKKDRFTKNMNIPQD